MTRHASFTEKPSPRLHEARGYPTLCFSPTAWAKLLLLRDAGDTEVGGFGIATADDLLLIEDVQLVRQICDVASVAFDDGSVADYFDRQVDAGISPARCGRVWLHTHPGDSPQPSMTDEETFARSFGRTDWAVMFILARSGQSYARLRFHVGPGGDIELPVQVDYRRPFTGSDHAAWLSEYQANVETPGNFPLAGLPEPWDGDWIPGWERLFEQGGFIDKEHSHAV